MSDPFFVVAAAVLGAIVGSYLNAVIYRMPRRRDGESFGVRSQCPKCGERIPGWLNVPVLAWLLLRGRARCCGATIHWRYPLVEALTSVLFAWLMWYPPSGLAFRYEGYGWAELVAFLLHAYFVANLIANTFIDIDFRILPDRLTKPLMVVGVVGAFVSPSLMPPLIEGVRASAEVRSGLASLLGLAVGFGTVWAVRALGQVVFRKEAMGFGDVKLMGGVGAFLGWQGALLTFFVGCIAGALFGVLLKLVTKDSEIAFGPYLVLGALATLFAYEPMLEFFTVTWPQWQHEQLQSPLAMAAVAAVSLVLLFVLIRRGRNS